MLVPIQTRRRSAGWVLALIAVLGCDPHRVPHDLGTTRLWRQYESLPASKAFAIAGDPERVWVAGMAGGIDDQDDANATALSECRRQRDRRRIKDPCVLYASGNRIVWADRDRR